jgi:hypothetical protein
MSVPATLTDLTDLFKVAGGVKKTATFISKINKELIKFPVGTIEFTRGNVTLNHSTIPTTMGKETEEFMNWLKAEPFTAGGQSLSRYYSETDYPKENENLKKQITLLEQEKAEHGAAIATLRTNQTLATAGLNARIHDKDIHITRLESDKAALTETLQSKSEEYTSLKAAKTSENKRLISENDELKDEITRLERKTAAEKRTIASENKELKDEIAMLKKRINRHAGQGSSANESTSVSTVMDDLVEGPAMIFMQIPSLVSSAINFATGNKRPRLTDDARKGD